jgi:hypothetical protein
MHPLYCPFGTIALCTTLLKCLTIGLLLLLLPLLPQ